MIPIFVRTVIIYLLLNVMLKIMGKRQIGELEVNELVTTLLISEIASIPISEPDVPLLASVFPILFICTLEIIISAVKTRCTKLKRLVEGTPVYIIYKGRLQQSILDKNRISINEILTELRTQGIGDISEVEYGILEQNGKISIFKKDDIYAHTIIIDGKLNKQKCEEFGIKGDFIEMQLKSRGLKCADVFLMTVSDEGDVNIIEKEQK